VGGFSIWTEKGADDPGLVNPTIKLTEGDQLEVRALASAYRRRFRVDAKSARAMAISRLEVAK
jgi:hypothetical protein